MGAGARAPASLRLQLSQPVQVVAAVRASVWPAAVQRPQHAVLVADEQSHLHPPSAAIAASPSRGAPIHPLPAEATGRWRAPICTTAGKKLCRSDSPLARHETTPTAGDWTRALHPRSRLLLDPKPIVPGLPSLSEDHARKLQSLQGRWILLPLGHINHVLLRMSTCSKSDDRARARTRHARHADGTASRSPRASAAADHDAQLSGDRGWRSSHDHQAGPRLRGTSASDVPTLTKCARRESNPRPAA